MNNRELAKAMVKAASTECLIELVAFELTASTKKLLESKTSRDWSFCLAESHDHLQRAEDLLTQFLDEVRPDEVEK